MTLRRRYDKIKKMNWSHFAGFLPRLFNKSGLPIHFTFFVTAKCNAVCITCFYANNLNKSQNELTVDEIEKTARSLGPLLWLAYTGGEPFLRKDLPEISKIFYRATRPRTLSINTNGIRTSEIVESARKIAENMPETFISILVSIDGLGEVHDEIRGVPGNFVKAIETFRALKELRKSCDHMGVGISTTFNAKNQDHVFEMPTFVIDQLQPDNWDISFIRGTPKEPVVGSADVEKFRRFKRIVESAFEQGKLRYYDQMPLHHFVHAKERVAYRQLLRTLQTKEFQTPCYAGALSAILTEEGDVYPCELLDMKIGNLRQVGYDFKKLWSSQKADETRRFIRESKCFCTHECNTSINLLFNPAVYPRIAAEMFKEQISKSDMGEAPLNPVSYVTEAPAAKGVDKKIVLHQ